MYNTECSFNKKSGEIEYNSLKWQVPIQAMQKIVLQEVQKTQKIVFSISLDKIKSAEILSQFDIKKVSKTEMTVEFDIA